MTHNLSGKYQEDTQEYTRLKQISWELAGEISSLKVPDLSHILLMSLPWLMLISLVHWLGDLQSLNTLIDF